MFCRPGCLPRTDGKNYPVGRSALWKTLATFYAPATTPHDNVTHSHSKGSKLDGCNDQLCCREANGLVPKLRAAFLGAVGKVLHISDVLRVNARDHCEPSDSFGGLNVSGAGWRASEASEAGTKAELGASLLFSVSPVHELYGVLQPKLTTLAGA